MLAWGYQRIFKYGGAICKHGGTSAFVNVMVIAMVPPFRHRRQSEAIVEEGMGPDDKNGKISAGNMSKQGA